jgi:DNA-binding NtrC family response regulator
MELNFTREPFRTKESSTAVDPIDRRSLLCIALLTNDCELAISLRQSLQTLEIEIDHVRTIDEAKANTKTRDLIIVDLELGETWPNTIFRDFDNHAATHSVIILCRGDNDVSYYRDEAQNAVNIFSKDVVSDPRFYCVIYAAKLHAETQARAQTSAIW